MTIAETIKQNPSGLVARAYALAKKAHAGQKRASGDPYFNHPLGTAEILAGWGLDEETVAAGLLHDTLEDTPVRYEDLKKEFGENVAFMVEGVSKLGHIKFREGHGAAAQAESLRKLILALSEDLRVVFIKLADRLYNMKTLSALPSDKQKRIALETDEIYASLAYRLGMQNVAGELHDLAFPYLHPKEAAWLKETVAEAYEARLAYLKQILPEVTKILADHGLKPLSVDFRAKRWSSLHKKLLSHGMDLEKIYDLVAMRLIFQNTEECYGALGVIHQHWPPLPGRIKDYIAMPKINGYRSLHTTVFGPGKKIIEFQIRTQEMHDANENGIAAHWAYKQSGKFRDLARELKWVEQLRAWQESFNAKDPQEFLESLKVTFFKDRVFAMTPKGDVIDLPAGATPVDFAYEIHGDIGNSCVAAKVNNRFVPLETELRSGDFVEILTQKNKLPSGDWLKFVKTAKARDHIRGALKHKSRFSALNWIRRKKDN